jgi:rhodanese-related sulfurtransferase
MSEASPSHESDSGLRLLGGVLVIVLAGAALGIASNQIQRLSGSSRALPLIKSERKLATLESVMPPSPAPATSPATGAAAAPPAPAPSVSAASGPAGATPESAPGIASKHGTTGATTAPGASHATQAPASGTPGGMAGSQLGSQLAPGPGVAREQGPPPVRGTLPGTAPSPGVRPGVRETTLVGRGPDATGAGATAATPAHAPGAPKNVAPVTGTRAAPGTPVGTAPTVPAIPDTPEPLEVGYATVKALHDAGAALFVDARPADEFAQGHIPGAVNLPFDDVFTKPELAKSLDSRGRPIVAYCDGGNCELSKNLAFALIETGQKKVLVFTTGLSGWKDAGNRVVTGLAP